MRRKKVLGFKLLDSDLDARQLTHLMVPKGSSNLFSLVQNAGEAEIAARIVNGTLPFMSPSETKEDALISEEN